MNEKKKIAIFISGRGSNMKEIIRNVKEGILKDSCEIEFVFSNNPNAEGLIEAEKWRIKTLTIDSKSKTRKDYNKDLLSLIQKYKLDYIILAGYMKILSKDFVKAYRKKIVNIHPADTNKHRGLNAYKWAFENKLDETKITIHLVDKGIDTGKILDQSVVDLRGVKSIEEVEERGLKIEHQFYSKVLKKLFDGLYDDYIKNE